MTGLSWGLRIAAAAAIAFILISVPIHAFVAKGPFSWHIQQPEAWQGGLEVLMLAAALYAGFSTRRRRLGLTFALAAMWVYARRHGVDLSVVLIYLYAEAVMALGWLMLPMAGVARLPRAANLLVAGLLGTMAWSFVIWSAAALGFGTLGDIRVIAVLVLGAALLAVRRARLGASLVRTLRRENRLERVVVAFAAAFLLAMFAKAAVVIDYDSFWYGLQGEEVLVGAGGLYNFQGLASVAHYYPKLYEALLLPFSGLGSVSMIFGVGILGALLLMITVIAILREYNVDRLTRVCIGVAAGTIPAVANIAVTAKGDMISSWLLLLGLLALIRFRKGVGGTWAWIALSSLSLSVLARLSNLPYAAILAAIVVWSMARRGYTGDSWGVLRNRGLWVALFAAVVSALVLARSYLLAGILIVAPNAVVRLQQSLGMELKYPVGLLPPDDTLPRLSVGDALWSFLFDPSSLPHVLITWTGNVWLFVPIAACLLGARLRTKGPALWPVILIGLSFFVLLLSYRFLVKGGDGNYFIVPIICLLLAGGRIAGTIPIRSRKPFTGMLLVFVLCNAAISFVTGSWGPGTRRFDAVMTRLPFEMAQYTDQALVNARMQGVQRFFRDKPPGTRVVGLERGAVGTSLPAGGWLPVQYEALYPYLWQQPELVASSEALETYLLRAGIQYVIVPSEPVPAWIEFSEMVDSALGTLKAAGLARIAHRDADYLVWAISEAYIEEVALAGGGRAQVRVAIDQICAGHDNAVATVSWTAPVATMSIEIRAPQSPVSSLWAELAGVGIQTTGPWVAKGAEFTFRRGRAGDLLGKIEVVPACRQ